VTKLLLSIHVLAAIIAIGPVTVAASMFPAATRRALADPTDQRGVAVLHNLHRICRVYAALGVLVPVFGVATASSLDVLGDAWLITSIILTVAAAAVLAFLVLPRQAAILTTFDAGRTPGSTDALATSSMPFVGTAFTTTTTDSDGPSQQSRSAMPTAADPGEAREALPAKPAAAQPGEAREPLPAKPAAAQPGEARGALPGDRIAARLGMVTGVFNLLWAVVVVLMIVRPGSTTGA
jgi:uncharacterized membrane protein